MIVTGKVLSVETRNLAEPATAAAAIGATVVSVADAATFDELGGQVIIGGAIYSYTSIDVDVDTITLAAALTTAVEDQDSVEIYPPLPVKTALVGLGDDGDPTPATVPHALLDRLPDGTRDGVVGESVLIEQRGVYDFVVTDIVAEPLTQQSLDFVSGEGGYGLSESIVQMQDVAILGELGASSVSGDTISLAGADLATLIFALPRGRLLEGRKATGTNAGSIAGTEAGVFLFNVGNLTASRAYRLTAQFYFAITGTVANDTWRVHFRYTTNGTEPTVSSPLLPGTKAQHYFSLQASSDVHLSTPFEIAADAPIQILMTAQRVAGATTGAIYQVSNDLPLILSLYDDGPVGSLSTTAIKQRLGLVEGAPISPFTKTFNALWAWGVNSAGDLINDSWFSTGDGALGSNSLYGLVGFDSSAIVAALANATTPTDVVLRWRARTRATSTGLDVRIMTHNYASRAAATTDIGYPQEYTGAPVGALTVVTTKVNAAPNVQVDTSLGATVFNQFKNGSRKGIGIGSNNAPYTSHPDGTGTVYGNGTSECQLIFTYQGAS